MVARYDERSVVVSKRQWLNFRKKYLAKQVKENGWYECAKCGRWLLYPEVDHIVKRSVAPDRVLDESNLQVLCHSCHVAKDGGMRRVA